MTCKTHHSIWRDDGELAVRDCNERVPVRVEVVLPRGEDEGTLAPTEVAQVGPDRTGEHDQHGGGARVGLAQLVFEVRERELLVAFLDLRGAVSATKQDERGHLQLYEESWLALTADIGKRIGAVRLVVEDVVALLHLLEEPPNVPVLQPRMRE